MHLDAAEHETGIVLLHSVKPGPASRSYGLQVAQLAGIPAPVIAQARGKLRELESQGGDALPVDGHSALESPVKGDRLAVPATNPVFELLTELDPDTVSARDALGILYELKTKLTRTQQGN